jgi:hypothetical protein
VTAARPGLLVGGSWLIGLGGVFLVEQGAGWTWAQAWPLFVILVGVASGVSALLSENRGRGVLWALTWPAAWVVAGILLLASTTGALAVQPGTLVADGWPWALVILGVWFLAGAFLAGGQQMSALVVPLNGAQQARVRIKFGAGELVTHVAAPGSLVDGSFDGGVKHRVDGPGQVELVQDLDHGWPWFDPKTRWDVGLPAGLPLDLRLETGACRETIDLSDLRVSRLELHTGASETTIRLPRAAGSTSVRAEAGAASLTIEVPPGVAARIHSRMALGSTQVDPGLFQRTGDGYESPGYDTAANRADVDVQGGVGQLRVIASR